MLNHFVTLLFFFFFSTLAKECSLLTTSIIISVIVFSYKWYFFLKEITQVRRKYGRWHKIG